MISGKKGSEVGMVSVPSTVNPSVGHVVDLDGR